MSFYDELTDEFNSDVNINSYLHYAFYKFTKGLSPQLKELVEADGFIAGGAVRDLIDKNIYGNDVEINDIDIYFHSESSLEIIKKILKDSVGPDETEPFSDRNISHFDFRNAFQNEMAFNTENACSFTCHPLNKRVQLILLYSGTEKQVLGRFDFTQSMFSYNPRTDSISANGDALEHLKRKELHFNKKCFSPVQSLKRLKKFYDRGYTIDNANLLALAEAAAESSFAKKQQFINEPEHGY